jgi:hypothetical protein
MNDTNTFADPYTAPEEQLAHRRAEAEARVAETLAACSTADAKFQAERQAVEQIQAYANSYRAAAQTASAELLTCDLDAVEDLTKRRRKASENQAVFEDRARALQPRIDAAQAALDGAHAEAEAARLDLMKVELDALSAEFVAAARGASQPLAELLGKMILKRREAEGLAASIEVARTGQVPPGGISIATPVLAQAELAGPNATALEAAGKALYWYEVTRLDEQHQLAEFRRRQAAAEAEIVYTEGQWTVCGRVERIPHRSVGMALVEDLKAPAVEIVPEA